MRDLKTLTVVWTALVGVLSADMALGLPDFRAAERTYQLLTQVAGRAGRGSEPGLVVVQTFSPDHPAIQAAGSGSSERFYSEEVLVRSLWLHGLLFLQFLAVPLVRLRDEGP